MEPLNSRLSTPKSPKCCFLFDGILGMKVLSVWLLMVTAGNYLAANDTGKFVCIVQFVIAVFMLSFLIYDSPRTRKLLVWALRMRLTSDIVMTVLVALGISKGDFTDQELTRLWGVVAASVVFAALDIHYIMVAQKLVIPTKRRQSAKLSNDL